MVITNRYNDNIDSSVFQHCHHCCGRQYSCRLLHRRSRDLAVPLFAVTKSERRTTACTVRYPRLSISRSTNQAVAARIVLSTENLRCLSTSRVPVSRAPTAKSMVRTSPDSMGRGQVEYRSRLREPRFMGRRFTHSNRTTYESSSTTGGEICRATTVMASWLLNQLELSRIFPCRWMCNFLKKDENGFRC